MYKVFQVVVCCVILLTSCKDKIICPAFQSTYILDDSTRTAYFSYAWKLDEAERQEFIDMGYGSGATTNTEIVEDTQPLDTSASPIAEAPMMEYFAYAEEYVVDPYPVKKNKYGIMKLPPFIYKNYLLKMSPMENVLGPEEEEPEIMDEGEFVAEDFVETDSLAEGEEIPVALQDEEETEEQEQRYLFEYDPKDDFNVDQEYYNKYFGELFIDNSPPEPEEEEITEEEMESDTTATKKKGLFGGGLFGKKKKDQEEDEDTEDEDPEEDPE